MRNNLTPAQRREKWILVFIFFILLGINIGFLVQVQAACWVCAS